MSEIRNNFAPPKADRDDTGSPQTFRWLAWVLLLPISVWIGLFASKFFPIYWKYYLVDEDLTTTHFLGVTATPVLLAIGMWLLLKRSQKSTLFFFLAAASSAICFVYSSNIVITTGTALALFSTLVSAALNFLQRKVK